MPPTAPPTRPRRRPPRTAARAWRRGRPRRRRRRRPGRRTECRPGPDPTRHQPRRNIYMTRAKLSGMRAKAMTTAPEVLRAQAAQRGDHALLVCDDDVLTYAEADARSAELASRLTARGAGP